MQGVARTHKAIAEYYRALQEYDAHEVSYEGATRSAFQNLLATVGREFKWTLIPEQPLANGKRPDGTLRDTYNYPRGYWEAKDTRDDLATEIRKKIALGYPISNTIFEDTQHAVLYQNQRPVMNADLRLPQGVADLLQQFFNHTEAEIASFETAVREFQDRIPDLAEGLKNLIGAEREKSAAFRTAFEQFQDLCRVSLDPHIRQETIDEMLVQHLLTERLFRTIFNDPDFIRRNAVAQEIEKVIGVLTSRSFNRTEFLRSLDRFYIAIEDAARGLEDWQEKQRFLNTVYERFFQGFSVKQADTHGIVYTPQEIVDFMCASVEEVLRTEFGTSLSEPGVQILDPATGTGNFIVNLLRRIAGKDLEYKYANDLFANEIMLLPYYIASLNIEHAYYERTGQYKPFEGICFADTLDLAEARQMSLFVERNTERVEREKAAQIRVIIGNPPYNVGQVNENDNNKNRAYKTVDGRIRQTYVADSAATSNSKIYDAYVRFFRWASDRLGENDGIVCLVTNNSFADQIAFDGMRKHLLQDFTHIYHLDLHGDVRRNPKISGTSHNVFGIQVGVGITVAIRSQAHSERKLLYHRVPEDWRKERKLFFLNEKSSIADIEWHELQPDKRATWLTRGLRPEFESYVPMGTKEAKSARHVDVGGVVSETIFKAYSLGVNTARDQIAYDFNRIALMGKVKRFIETYNGEVDRWKRRGPEAPNVDDFVTYDDSRIKWSEALKLNFQRSTYAEYSESKIRRAAYRPFCTQWLFFDRLMNERVYQQPQFFPVPSTENSVICVPGPGNRKEFGSLIVGAIPSLDLAFEKAQCFPFYTYAEDGSNRRENITDWALGQFQAAYGAGVTKRDIFNYVYAILHLPEYRERYAENLKRELPRIPLVEGADAFATCARIGGELAALHLGYEQAKEYRLRWVETPDVPVNWRVDPKMRLTADKTAVVYNDWLRLEGIPADAFEYRLGNRSALDWVLDQYQVSTDRRSGITSDPNREDDPQYIARLVAKVTQVSVETVRLVGELSAAVTLVPAEASVAAM